MAPTASTMLPLGVAAPHFRLPDPAGKVFTLADFKDAKALVVGFLCNHCPYVKHIQAELAKVVREYQDKEVAFVAISSNDVERYPDDSPERMAEESRQAGYTFPYLYDETQEVAKAYRAACTPEFYVFNAERHLVYRGQFDDSRPRNDLPVTGRDLRAALDAILASKPVSPDQKAGIGCNIKWKPGNEPDYFSS